jgi:serine O-acetyltransferase
MKILRKLAKRRNKKGRNKNLSSCAGESAEEFSEVHGDLLVQELQKTALSIEQTEPLIAPLLRATVLHPSNDSLASIVARTISFRLLQSCSSSHNSNSATICYDNVFITFLQTMHSDELENGHTMLDAIRIDLQACVDRDPACESPLEALLFYKGFASLVCHRAARRMWNKQLVNGKTLHSSKYVSLWLQSQASAAFGLDIHPGAEIGAGMMLDHGTGIVIGETAKVDDHCTFLHGVTLGGTGKHHGDRHPKIGKHVLIGAGASILGNIRIGDGAKIGAGSLVLKPIPHGCTAVGSPARIIGFAQESRPGSSLDNGLSKTVPIGGLGVSSSGSGSYSSLSSGTKSTVPTSGLDDDDDGDDDEDSDTDDNDDDNGNDKNNDNGSDENINIETTRIPRDSKVRIAAEESSPSSKHARTNDASICAFRFFRCKGLPCGAISFQCLSKMLSDYCTEEEIGEVYMALLKLNPALGYIPSNVMIKKFAKVVHKYTKLDENQSQMILGANINK